MNSLLGRQVDSSYIVRMYSIRGLGNMADIEGNQVCIIIYTITTSVTMHDDSSIKVFYYCKNIVIGLHVLYNIL